MCEGCRTHVGKGVAHVHVHVHVHLYLVSGCLLILCAVYMCALASVYMCPQPQLGRKHAH